MTDRSSVIFGNKMPDKVYKKAVKSKKKYIKKFGDDSRKNYEVSVEKNRYIGDSLGVYNILVGNPAENAHYDVNAHAEKGTFDTEKGIIVGNIRGIRTLPHFDGDGVCGEGDGLYALLDGLKFLWRDDQHESDRRTE